MPALPFTIDRPSRPINEIILHCTATPEGRPVRVAQIRAWHLARGWNDIGYHYVIGIDGEIWRGRPLKLVGAHVAGHNVGTIGIAYVGGDDKDTLQPKDTRNKAQLASLDLLCRELIRVIPTIERITGHNDYDKGKACPSFKVAPTYIDTVR
jgi:N-acetylmuramoyl-L-alanine amidase